MRSPFFPKRNTFRCLAGIWFLQRLTCKALQTVRSVYIMCQLKQHIVLETRPHSQAGEVYGTWQQQPEIKLDGVWEILRSNFCHNAWLEVSLPGHTLINHSMFPLAHITPWTCCVASLYPLPHWQGVQRKRGLHLLSHKCLRLLIILLLQIKTNLGADQYLNLKCFCNHCSGRVSINMFALTAGAWILRLAMATEPACI